MLKKLKIAENWLIARPLSYNPLLNPLPPPVAPPPMPPPSLDGQLLLGIEGIELRESLPWG